MYGRVLERKEEREEGKEGYKGEMEGKSMKEGREGGGEERRERNNRPKETTVFSGKQEIKSRAHPHTLRTSLVF